VTVLLGVVLGAALTAAGLALWRLARAPQRVLAPEGEAMQAALHAAAATLPHLRLGLSRRSAARAAPYLRALVQSDALALADTHAVLAADGAPWLAPGRPVEQLLEGGLPERVRVEARLCDAADGIGQAIVAPLVVQDERVGALIALYREDERLGPEDTRVVGEAAQLVAAQVELAAVADQEERLARAELRALRAQISPHFIYNALAAVANQVHKDPEEARELLIEFAEFTRYAFRGERKHVTLADELRYVEKYLRLEQARFGTRLTVRVEVAPEVLGAVVPVLTLQPLVENAVRHGVESRVGGGTVELLGRDLGEDVELVVRDDGPGIAPDLVPELLAGRRTGEQGGLGLANVHQRLQATFGEGYGLEIKPRPARGTEVVLSVPKFRAGVRAA